MISCKILLIFVYKNTYKSNNQEDLRHSIYYVLRYCNNKEFNFLMILGIYII